MGWKPTSTSITGAILVRSFAVARSGISTAVVMINDKRRSVL